MSRMETIIIDDIHNRRWINLSNCLIISKFQNHFLKFFYWNFEGKSKSE